MSKSHARSVKSKRSLSRASRRSIAAGSAHKYAKQSILGALNDELEKRSQVAKDEEIKDMRKYNTIDRTNEDPEPIEDPQTAEEVENSPEAQEVDLDKIEE